jgi:hypothetical protein
MIDFPQFTLLNLTPLVTLSVNRLYNSLVLVDADFSLQLWLA